MTRLFSTLSSLSLAQDRNSGNQNTWRNDCMFSSVQWLSRVWLFGTPWPAGRWASVSITNSRGLLKLMSIESVMPSNHLSLCRPLLLCLQSRRCHLGPIDLFLLKNARLVVAEVQGAEPLVLHDQRQAQQAPIPK